MVTGKKYGNPRRIIRSERFFKMGCPYVFSCCVVVYRNLILLPYDLYGKKRIKKSGNCPIFLCENSKRLFVFLEEKAMQIILFKKRINQMCLTEFYCWLTLRQILILVYNTI